MNVRRNQSEQLGNKQSTADHCLVGLTGFARSRLVLFRGRWISQSLVKTTRHFDTSTNTSSRHMYPLGTYFWEEETIDGMEYHSKMVDFQWETKIMVAGVYRRTTNCVWDSPYKKNSSGSQYLGIKGNALEYLTKTFTWSFIGKSFIW